MWLHELEMQVNVWTLWCGGDQILHLQAEAERRHGHLNGIHEDKDYEQLYKWVANWLKIW